MNIQINRRAFLKSAALVSTVGIAPNFLARAALGANAPIQGFDDGRILVVVQLAGGNDGLNALVPYGDDAYYKARPTIGLKSNSLLKLNDYLAFNDRLKGMKSLYDSGQLAIVQGVGYPNPDRSHFRSMEIWETASDSDEFLGRGWIGRYFDNHCSGEARPHAGVALTKERPQAFDGENGFGIAFQNPHQFGWRPGKGADNETNFEKINSGAAKNPTLDFLRHTTANGIASTHEVRAAAKDAKVKADPRKPLETIAGLIRGGMQTRIYYANYSGFDTHANQLGSHGNLLSAVGDQLLAFQESLERDGLADQVVTVVFSEFGRRVGENGSGGTDHGTAAPMFAVGKNINPGIHGKAPSLTELDQGDLVHTTDFRGVYSDVLTNWFKVDAEPVLNGSFEGVPVIA